VDVSVPYRKTESKTLEKGHRHRETVILYIFLFRLPIPIPYEYPAPGAFPMGVSLKQKATSNVGALNTCQVLLQ